MKKLTFAAIDVGSNAVRLLIKCTTNNSADPLTKVQLVRVPLRLGQEAFIKGRIGKEKGGDMLRLMKAYKYLMKIYNVQAYRACATSAMREAADASLLVAQIYDRTGIKIEVISGEEEAELVSRTGINPAVRAQGSFLFTDVGGGSTELTLLQNGRPLKKRSFNIGTVRMLTGSVHTSEWELMEEYLRTLYSDYGPCRIIGSGGNINRLVRLNGSGKSPEGLPCISVHNLQELYASMSQLTQEERMVRYNLKTDRADVIVPAASVFLQVAKTLQAPYIIVPTSGLADGIIDLLYTQYLNPKVHTGSN